MTPAGHPPTYGFGYLSGPADLATLGLQALGVPGSRCGAMVLTRAPERGTSFRSAARRAVSLPVDLVDELFGDLTDLGVARGGGTRQESERAVLIHPVP